MGKYGEFGIGVPVDPSTVAWLNEGLGRDPLFDALAKGLPALGQVYESMPWSQTQKRQGLKDQLLQAQIDHLKTNPDLESAKVDYYKARAEAARRQKTGGSLFGALAAPSQPADEENGEIPGAPDEAETPMSSTSPDDEPSDHPLAGSPGPAGPQGPGAAPPVARTNPQTDAMRAKSAKHLDELEALIRASGLPPEKAASIFAGIQRARASVAGSMDLAAARASSDARATAARGEASYANDLSAKGTQLSNEKKGLDLNDATRKSQADMVDLAAARQEMAKRYGDNDLLDPTKFSDNEVRAYIQRSNDREKKISEDEYADTRAMRFASGGEATLRSLAESRGNDNYIKIADAVNELNVRGNPQAAWDIARAAIQEATGREGVAKDDKEAQKKRAATAMLAWAGSNLPAPIVEVLHSLGPDVAAKLGEELGTGVIRKMLRNKGVLPQEADLGKTLQSLREAQQSLDGVMKDSENAANPREGADYKARAGKLRQLIDSLIDRLSQLDGAPAQSNGSPFDDLDQIGVMPSGK